jgi:cardiolipin synthase
MSAGKRISHSHYTQFNKVKLVRGGRDYFNLLEELIANANESIFFQTYIFEEDKTGLHIADALIQAAQRGIKIFLLLDGYASQNLSDDFIRKLESSGIIFRWFEPLLHSSHFYFGRRLHHKVVVVDGRHCLVGGINVSDRYNDIDGHIAWLDWAIYAEGEVALSVYRVCARRATKSWAYSGPRAIPAPTKQMAIKHKCQARMIVNDWVRGKNEIYSSYLLMLRTAEKEIIMVSSYFLPGWNFQYRMKQAVRRGVKIKVILTRESDVALAKSAELYLYPWLFKNNVEVFEYTKTILHGKITVCDRAWVSAGSFNLNDLSALASVEMNLEVLDEKFGTEVHHSLSEIIKRDCAQVTPEDFKIHSVWWRSMWHRAAYIILRLILFLFTFYFKRERS